MKSLLKRAKYVLGCEDGASNVEIIVWFSVVFVIATALFAFRTSVVGFVTGITTNVGGLAKQ